MNEHAKLRRAFSLAQHYSSSAIAQCKGCETNTRQMSCADACEFAWARHLAVTRIEYLSAEKYLTTTEPIPLDREHSELIARLYEVALGEAHWSDFLIPLKSALGTEGTCVWSTTRLKPKFHWMHSVGFDPWLTREYQAYYGGIDPTPPLAQKHAGVAVTDQVLLPRGEFERSEFYNDCLAKVGWAHILGSIVLLTNDRVAAVSTQRSHGQGEFSASDVQKLQRLVPHIARTIKIQDAVAERDWKAIALRRALDQVPFGMILLGRGQRVLELNALAAACVESSAGLSIARQTLRVAPGDAMRPLRNALTQCIQGVMMGIAAEPRFIQVLAKNRRLRVAVLPFNPAMHAAADIPRPLVVLGLFDGTVAALRSDFVMRTFGLTAREAEVALLLAEGMTLESIAHELQLASETARNHVKRVMQKMGVHRQSEVVRLLLTMPLRPWTDASTGTDHIR